MTRITSTSARLAALAVGGVLLAGCGSIESPVTPPAAVAAAKTPVQAGAFGVALLGKVEREVTARSKRAIRRSGAEVHFVNVSCAADDERQFTCATVARDAIRRPLPDGRVDPARVRAARRRARLGQQDCQGPRK